LHGGRWVLRRYLGGQTYATESIGTADDNQDADNVSILTFFQAQAKARELAKGYREAPAGAAKLTVRANRRNCQSASCEPDRICVVELAQPPAGETERSDTEANHNGLPGSAKRLCNAEPQRFA
jgi:hypothetical protein